MFETNPVPSQRSGVRQSVLHILNPSTRRGPGERPLKSYCGRSWLNLRLWAEPQVADSVDYRPDLARCTRCLDVRRNTHSTRSH